MKLLIYCKWIYLQLQIHPPIYSIHTAINIIAFELAFGCLHSKKTGTLCITFLRLEALTKNYNYVDLEKYITYKYYLVILIENNMTEIIQNDQFTTSNSSRITFYDICFIVRLLR